jgi:uncharacterized protein
VKLIQDSFQLSPSDLVNHLGCKHLTELNRQIALGNRRKPDWNDPALAILHKKGLEHEEAYLNSLKDQHLKIIDLSEKGFDSTMQAMKDGYDVIFQARLKEDQWGGIADFLIRKPGESSLGEYYYEVEDTKLAQATKAGTILQLCVYSEIISKIQYKPPVSMYVVKPGTNFPKDPYRYADYQYYYQSVKHRFEDVILSGSQETYPIPVEKCSICQFWKECDDRWHEDDDLSLIAGLRRDNRKVLEQEGIQTLEGFASRDKPLNSRPKIGAIETFEKLYSQAKVQLKGRKENKNVYELLGIEEKRGLNRLPEPTDHDLYFDIEGDHYYEDGGLEYLFGVVYRNQENQLTYKKFWCENRKSEKDAFIELLKFFKARWEENPDMHIYHYGHYEPSAIKRLASRHAILEKEVDDFLRSHKFVNLFSVIKESLQASVESYSLKDLEKFTEYLRSADLRAASAARRSFSAALELGQINNLKEEIRPLIDDYNRDDCLATEELHRWIEGIFQDEKDNGKEITRPKYEDTDASDQVKARDQKAIDLYIALTENISLERSERNQHDQAKWLLAHMVAYHRREERSNAWEFHHLNNMELDELLYERKAISYLKIEKDISEGKKILHQYRFPAQEISLKPGDTLKAIKGETVGSIHSINKESLVISKNNKSEQIHPDAVIENNYIPSAVLENALHDLAEDVIQSDFEISNHYSIAKDILMSQRPEFNSEQDLRLRRDGESLVDAGIRLANDLKNSYLPIQGPPGTGKSYTGAHIIIDLVQKGKKVGITAVGHSVIRGLIDKVLDLASEQGVVVECVHKTTKNNEREGLTFQSDNGRAIKALNDAKVVGGTAFLWARQEAIDCMDYLFIDEAGQMSLAYVLAISRSAKSVILLGDPQQLEQPQKGAHPEGADVSALEHILMGKKTMPPEKGLFLDTTWRLNPEICAFTSEIYYEGRLLPEENTSKQVIKSSSRFKGQGLFFVPVEHEGNRNKAVEEVEEICTIVEEILRDAIWLDRNGIEHRLATDDILIVAPYNAQVNALSEVLPDIKVGTVDKFQGKEAPVVIYSMASSSPEEAPRGMSFLYDPNRLNVATSRAQCICILVSSPNLFEPECKTIDQMSWANGLCKYFAQSK